MVKKGILIKKGNYKGTHYILSSGTYWHILARKFIGFITFNYSYTNEMMTYYGLNNLTNTGNQDELDVWVFGCPN